MLFVLVGPTRAGKSTFINTVLGKHVSGEHFLIQCIGCRRGQGEAILLDNKRSFEL